MLNCKQAAPTQLGLKHPEMRHILPTAAQSLGLYEQLAPPP
jgi:hypothetical protein